MTHENLKRTILTGVGGVMNLRVTKICKSGIEKMAVSENTWWGTLETALFFSTFKCDKRCSTIYI